MAIGDCQCIIYFVAPAGSHTNWLSLRGMSQWTSFFTLPLLDIVINAKARSFFNQVRESKMFGHCRAGGMSYFQSHCHVFSDIAFESLFVLRKRKKPVDFARADRLFVSSWSQTFNFHWPSAQVDLASDFGASALCAMYLRRKGRHSTFVVNLQT